VDLNGLLGNLPSIWLNQAVLGRLEVAILVNNPCNGDDIGPVILHLKAIGVTVLRKAGGLCVKE